MNDLDWTGERLTTAKRNEIMIHHLHRYALALKLVEGCRVLDIASGEGYGSYLLAEKAKTVIGVDIDEKTISFSRNKYVKQNLTFMQGSTSKIPCADHSFDVIVSFETIEHHDEHHEMMSEFKRVLAKDGILIISSPDKHHYSDVTNFKNPFHVKELYQSEFKKLLNDYFKNTTYLNQNIYYNSIIIPETKTKSSFLEYTGDFDHITEHQTLSEPMYNICIASDMPLDFLDIPLSSVFNSPDLLFELKNKESEIYNSKTYKIGRLVTSPWRVIRKFINS